MSPQRMIGAEARSPFRWVTLPGGPVIVTDASRGFHFRVPVTEACTLEPPLNGTPGQPITYRIEQPVDAGYAVSVHSAWSQRGTVVISSAAEAVSYLSAICRPDGTTWELAGVPDLSSVYDPAGTATALMAAHLAATNPHPQYQLSLVTAVTTTYTVLSTDYTVICTSAAPFVVTLLTAIGRAGQVFHIKNSGVGAVTIATSVGQTIDGYASGDISLAQYDNLTVQSNGTNWIIL